MARKNVKHTKIQLLERVVKDIVSKMIHESETASPEFDKQNVRKFFSKFNNSPYKIALQKLSTSSEKVEAIIKMAQIIGVPKAGIPAIIAGLKTAAGPETETK